MTESEDKIKSSADVVTELQSEITTEDKSEKLKIPKEIPVLPVKDTVVFPGMVAALTVSTERDLKLLNHVLAGNRFLALVAQKEKDIKVIKQIGFI